MRHLVLVLMLVLLPLRGWLGEAMATEMAMASAAAATPAAHGPCAGHAAARTSLLQTAPQTAAPDPAAHGLTHASHPADHGATASGTPGCNDSPHDAGAHGDSASCLGCQACHSLALTTDFHAPPAARLPADRPGARPPAFSSAVPARGLKPPIL